VCWSARARSCRAPRRVAVRRAWLIGRALRVTPRASGFRTKRLGDDAAPLALLALTPRSDFECGERVSSMNEALAYITDDARSP
jgi:hypothetical protein